MPIESGSYSLVRLVPVQTHVPDGVVEARPPRLDGDDLDELGREEVAVDGVAEAKRLLCRVIFETAVRKEKKFSCLWRKKL